MTREPLRWSDQESFLRFAETVLVLKVKGGIVEVRQDGPQYYLTAGNLFGSKTTSAPATAEGLLSLLNSLSCAEELDGGAAQRREREAVRRENEEYLARSGASPQFGIRYSQSHTEFDDQGEACYIFRAGPRDGDWFDRKLSVWGVAGRTNRGNWYAWQRSPREVGEDGFPSFYVESDTRDKAVRQVYRLARPHGPLGAASSPQEDLPEREPERFGDQVFWLTRRKIEELDEETVSFLREQRALRAWDS